MITVFDAATGQALYTTSGVQHPIHLQPGQTWRDGDWPGDAWRLDLATGEPAQLLVFDPMISLNTLAGIPAGTTALIPALSLKEVVNDGVIDIELELGLPESVHVILSKPGYATWRDNVPCV